MADLQPPGLVREPSHRWIDPASPVNAIGGRIHRLSNKAARRWSIGLAYASVLLVMAGTLLVELDATNLLVVPMLVVSVLCFVFWWPIRAGLPGTRPRVEVDNIYTRNAQSAILDGLIDQAIQASTRYGHAALALLADMLAEPATYRRRVVEDVILARREARKVVRINSLIEDEQFKVVGAERRIVIPLIQPRKGRLYDRLSIHEGLDGGSVIRLSYNESMRTYVSVLLHLYCSAYGLTPIFRDWPDEDRRAFSGIVATIAQSASSIHDLAIQPLDAGDRTKPDLVEKAILSLVEKYRLEQADALRPVTREPGEGDESYARRVAQLDRLQRVAEIGIRHYFILVECEPTQRSLLTYEYRQPTASLMRRADIADSSLLTRFLQDLFGVPSGYLITTIARARHAQSYHMHVEVPAGSYFGPTHVSDGEAPVQVNPRPPLSFGVPYLRPIVKAGPTIHLYGRNLDKVAKRLFLRTRICERPSGSELFALISALTVLLLEIVFLRLSGSNSVHTDIAVATLALPATVAALAVYFGSALRRSLIVSTGGAALTFLAGGLAVVTMALFDFEASRDREVESHFWSGFWDATVAIAFGLFAISLGTLLIRTRRYIRDRAIPKLE